MTSERLRILHMQFDFQIDGGGEFSLCFVCNLIYQIQDCVHTRLCGFVSRDGHFYYPLKFNSLK